MTNQMMEVTENPVHVRRTHMDTVFRMLFSTPDELLGLYNAVNGTNYRDASELKIITLKNAIYLKIKNDIGFIFNFQMHLYEHQSTTSVNLPLRMLLYCVDELKYLTGGADLEQSQKILIPEPRFFVFYNGRTHRPEQWVQFLSELYERPTDDPDLNLRIHWLNINKGQNKKIMDACETLMGYTQYVHLIRTYRETMSIEEAVDRAIDECIRDGFLVDFLKRQRAEVKAVSIYEYNEELHLKNVRNDGLEEGRKEGRQEGKYLHLLDQICRKLKVQKSAAQIAEDLMEDPEEIQELVSIAETFAPEYDVQAILEEVLKIRGAAEDKDE